MVLALVGAWGLVTVTVAMWSVARAGERGDLPRPITIGLFALGCTVVLAGALLLARTASRAARDA